MCQQLFTLPFVQAEQRVDIRTAITVLGVKPGYRLSGMVGTYYDTPGHASNAVLGLHTFTRFLVAAHKIA